MPHTRLASCFHKKFSNKLSFSIDFIKVICYKFN